MGELWDESKMDKPNFFKYNVHTIFQEMPSENVKKIASKLSLPLSICLLNFDGNSNIGMTIRTSAVMGIYNVYIIGKRAYDKRSTVGSHNYVKLHREGWVDDPVRFFEAEGCLPIVLEQGGEPLDEFNFRPYFNKKVVFIMGSEGNGVDKVWTDKLREGGAPFISISQCGLVRSLNVSIAASIAMYEYSKQFRKYQKDVGHLY
jgi:tRNA G18 (ribose-2'-O)-methylase SpoU